ncbi:MAG: energy-coupling factor transporter transmembrane component T [Anaerolineales bacterium]|jgi:energy-coupling factor transport system permease protein
MLVTWKYRKREKSLIQSFDPTAWIIFYLCYIVGTLMFWDLRYLAFYLAIAILVVATSGIPFRDMRRPWLFIGGFILFFTLLTFLTGRGSMEVFTDENIIKTLTANFTIFGWRPTLTISVEKLMFALSQFARVFSLATMTILIPYSLDPALYGITFRRLGLPDKIAYAMDLTMRFIPTFGRDFQYTMDAQKARGYEIEKLRGGLIAQVRKLAPLMVPVTIHALAGSEDIIDAMDLRGFGVGPRTWLTQLTYNRRDRALMIFGGLMLVGSVLLSMFGFGKFWVPEALLRLVGG